jgi:hypothetical protein
MSDHMQRISDKLVELQLVEGVKREGKERREVSCVVSKVKISIDTCMVVSEWGWFAYRRYLGTSA